MSFSKSVLGTELSRLRMQAGLSQSAVADKLGLSDKAVSKWETGATCPPLDTLIEVARLYGTTASEMVGLFESPMRSHRCIALSGGPCSGKSSSLAFLRSILTERGWNVIVIEETSTDLMEHGISRETTGSAASFESDIVGVQLAWENAAHKAGEHIGENTVVICDRTVIDCMAYLTNTEIEDVFGKHELSLEDAFKRYDAVFFMESAAKSQEVAYGSADNPARFESNAQACKANDDLRRIWSEHESFYEVKASGDFDNKMSELANLVLGFLGEEPLPQASRAYLVRKPQIEQIRAQSACITYETLITYLLPASDESAWLERIIAGNFVHYTYNTISSEGTHASRILSFAEYAALARYADPNFKPLESTRFVIKSSAYLLHINLYSFFPYQAIVEISGPDEAHLKPPSYIQTIRDITENDVYTPRAFARALAQGRL